MKIGIIGGSGLDDPDMFSIESERTVATGYGSPSSGLKFGKIGGTDVVLLARHGVRHQYSPTQVNYRANIAALRDAGVTHILATTACGSLREDIGRGHFVVLDQFIDFTRFRKTTFFDSFENGAVHTAMPEPFDAFLRRKLYEAGKKNGLTMHEKGCVITEEGPRFATRAESKMFRIWGADVVNMSVAPEAMLANEAKIPYAAVAMATDYDSWKADEAPVTWEQINEVFARNAENMIRLLRTAVTDMGKPE
jgi:5''-deoxy-5''-methylthioadenosine phosphorylase